MDDIPAGGHDSLAGASGYTEGERIAKRSTWTLLAIGVAEIASGQLTGSIGLTADGVDSLSDAFVSSMVWFGLKTSKRAPDEHFHFGYYKVESLIALVTSVILIGVGAGILYRSYLGFLNPQPVQLPALALVVLLGAGTVSLYRALQMRRTARKHRLLSLDLDSKNALKDGTASFLVFLAVLASSLGFPQMDAVGGIIVAAFIFTVSYVTLKQATLVLLDAFRSPEMVEEMGKLIKRTEEVKGIREIRLRMVGPAIKSEITIAVAGRMSVLEMHEVVNEVTASLRKNIPGMGDVVVRVVPAELGQKAEAA